MSSLRRVRPSRRLIVAALSATLAGFSAHAVHGSAAEAAAARPAVHPTAPTSAAAARPKNCRVRSGRKIVGVVKPTGRRSRDRDRDGLANGVEPRRFGTDSRRPDTDGDELGDGFEVDCSATDPLRRDTDRDGQSDGLEVESGTDPLRTENSGLTTPPAPQPPGDSAPPNPIDPGPGPDPEPAPSPDPPPAEAALYVSPSGDDTAAGSPSSPLRTIGGALARAVPGTTINVASGTYPEILDSATRDGQVTVLGVGASKPIVEGALLSGTHGMNISNLEFTAPINIRARTESNTTVSAEDITITDSAISAPDETCLSIRAAARIRVVGNLIENCGNGIGGPPTPESPSRQITIADNLIRDLHGDGIHFADWSKVTISGNTIRHMYDDALQKHTDGIQIFGGVEQAAITGNTISDSAHGQLIFIQDSYGLVNDLLVENNLLYDVSGFAIQNGGATQARYLHNTIWNAGVAALMIREGRSGTVPTDVVVVGNILDGLNLQEGAAIAVQRNNLIAATGASQSTPTDIVTADPGFVDLDGDDYRLAPGSPAIGAGSSSWSPDRDIVGALRSAPPSIGAFE